MTLHEQIRAAQRRLWLNRFIAKLTVCTTIGVASVGMIVFVQRLFDAALPISWIVGSLVGGAVVAAFVWTVATREDTLTASARLDEAAGLRERLSTAHYCGAAPDEFARAVVADAENSMRGIRVGRIISIKPPPQWGWAVTATVFAALPFLIPVGLLKPAQAKATEERIEAIESTRVAVKKQMDELRELAEKTPALQDVKPRDDDLDLGAAAREQSPADIRHEALKKIDRYEDALRQKKNSDRYDSLGDMKKMMRAIRPPNSNEAPTQNLAKALQQGDFKTAREEIEKLREQLATLKSDEDAEMVRKIGDQLEELSKQLEKLALDNDLRKQLEQAGLKKEDVEKALERLSKKDLDQLLKKLEESGMTKEQAAQLAKKLQQKEQSKSMAGKLAQSMQGSASQAKAGSAESASAKLAQAGEQLSELEQIEQEMSQLEAAANAVAEAKENLSNQCSRCAGSGKQGNKPCGACNGTGGQSGRGMGQSPGQGSGGRAESETSQVAFKTERQKVHSGTGAIIGQLVYEGEQVPGEASSKLAETIAAAEREASDAIHRDRVPRQYHKAVREYFSKANRGPKPAAKPSAADEPATEPATNEKNPADN